MYMTFTFSAAGRRANYTRRYYVKYNVCVSVYILCIELF